jgi:hypothetical protein
MKNSFLVPAILNFLFVVMLKPLQAFGKDYFQQRVNYSISAKLDERKHELHCFEKIIYINNSEDTLTFIWFHLWPNAYSGNNTDLARQLALMNGKKNIFNDPALRGSIDSIRFNVNDFPASFEPVPGKPDICRLILPGNLNPHDSVVITTPFRVKIPQGNISRMGFSDGVYQVSQWYPKPAVYDNEGWHPMTYLDQGEFFSEFGTYDVEINVPESYSVAASGKLLTDTAQSVGEWLIPGLNADRNGSKTLRYRGEMIHDFAWFAGNNFIVRTENVTLPRSGKVIGTTIMFTSRQAYLWIDALNYIRKSMLAFSDWIGDYPYDSFTAVQAPLAAGSGMEYPGVAVIGSADDAWSLENVIAHEVCHNWFYGAIASDERRYPYMDEGLATAYEVRYMNRFYPGKKLWEIYLQNKKMAKFLMIDKLPVSLASELDWLATVRNNLEQPVNLPAPAFTEANYGNMVYYKAGQGFETLRMYLGDNVFDSIMHDYYSIWKNRHPYPSDLAKVFEERSGKDLAWFFSDYLGTTKRTDYKIAALKDNRLLVKNRGELPAPFPVSGLKGDSTVFTSWADGFQGKRWIDLPPGDFTTIRLNRNHTVPEPVYTNNNINTSGVFRKSDKLRLHFMMTIEDPDKFNMLMLPLVNWNRTNGIMAGMAVKNNFLLPSSTEFLMIPFFTFRQPGIAGQGRIAYNLLPYNSPVRKAVFYVEGSRFGVTPLHDYNVINPGIDIIFKKADMIISPENSIHAKVVYATRLNDLFNPGKTGMIPYYEIGFSSVKETKTYPWSMKTFLESNGSYYKVSSELNYKLTYAQKDRALDMRLFAGVMLKEDPLNPYYSLSVSGRHGNELYLYEGDFPDRFPSNRESFWSRQILISEGGLVGMPHDSVRFSKGLVSATFVSNFPWIPAAVPAKPFLNILYSGGPSSAFYYEGGFKAGIWGLFEVYFPVISSNNMIKGPFKDRIRFVLNLESFYKIRLM